jgi:hypothetical protein
LALTGPIDQHDIASFDSVDAPVFLVPIENGAMGPRHPVEVRYREDGGPFGAPHLLSVLPLQGKPLAPHTLYAAVVTTALVDRSPAMDTITNARYQEALAALSGIDVAGLAVFETDDPTITMIRAREAAPVPSVATPFVRTDLFDSFCVYQATVPMPVYQSGTPPYEDDGGWLLDESGVPVLQGEETARIVVTLPRAPMPASGYPVMIFSRTGGGGDRPLVDRGVHLEAGGDAMPGTGPALELARVGFAGVSVDGPHGGMRNVTGGDEQFLMFNVENPTALRDNVRQSALELAVQARMLATMQVPDCAETGTARFDTTQLALMGHSMGATIAPLAMSADFEGLVLSGAGGSYIENVIHKLSPVPVRGFAELLLGVAGSWELTEHDPVVSLLQWAVEPADPPVYASSVAQPVLMLQGIVDTYILPPMANALSLALALDLAGEPLDATNPELASFTPLEPLLVHSGGARVPLPASGSVVVQHPEDGIENGHEVVFQTEAPKRQYRCFLATLSRGPTITTGLDDACP